MGKFMSVRSNVSRWFAAPLMGAYVFVALSAAPVQAQAQDVDALLNRIDRLERDLQTMQQSVYKGNNASDQGSSADLATMPADVAGRLQFRINELEALVSQLTGQFEQSTYQITQLNARLERMAADYEFRFKELEAGRGMQQPTGQLGTPGQPAANVPFQSGPTLLRPDQQVPSTAPQPQAVGSVTTDPTATVSAPPPEDESLVMLPEGTIQEQYNYTRKILRQGKYKSAEKALLSFLEKHPNDDLSGNAMYWLGETYYVRGLFGQAASTFLEGYQKYPDNSKAADNLLKLGMSLVKEGKTSDACTA